jgi:putative nucleotidyltransferase with HDIG domain
MKKKIKVSDARLGMHIDSLCGSWINHPFWKKSFNLDEQKDLDALLTCGTMEMWIDTELGLDVEAPGEREAKPAAGTAPADAAAKKAEVHEPPVVLSDELRRARKIHTQGRMAVTELFKMACDRGSIDLSGALILVDEIRRSTARNQNAFLSLMRPKEGDYLGLHSIAVCALMIMLGRSMEMDQETIMSLGLAGLLHDIGNSGIRQELMDMQGELTEGEIGIVHNHPKRGREILDHYNLDNIVTDICLHHHERADGKGYPDGLSLDELSVFARMAAICDTYDLLVSDNGRKKGISPANAIRRMVKLQEEGQFDKSVFHAFVKTMGLYPFGTLVKLKSGRVAVVEEQSKKSLAAPVVRVFYSIKMGEPIFQEWVDLSKVPDAIVSVEEPDALARELRIDLKLMAVI